MITCLLLLLPAFLFSQSPLLGIPDARARAAGGTGLAEDGLRALWRNPAGLAGSGALRAGVNYEQRFAVAELGIASAGVTWRGLGLQLASLTFDGYAEQRLGLAYGRALGIRSRIGAGLGYLSRQFPGFPGRGQVTWNVGGQHDFSEALTVGATVTYAGALLAAAGVRYRINPSVYFAVEGGIDASGRADYRFGTTYLPHEAVAVYLGGSPSRREITLGAGYRLTEGLRATVAVAVHERLGVSPLIGLVFAPSARE